MHSSESESEVEVDVQLVALANPEHRVALLTLLDHYAQDPMGGGAPLSAYARAHLIAELRTRAGYLGLLAYRAGVAVGLANCFEGFSTFAAKPLLNIHDLVVHRDARGRGIAQRLLARAEQEAHTRGCCKVTLEVLSLNRTALASYERFGFRAYQLDPQAGQALFLEKKLG